MAQTGVGPAAQSVVAPGQGSTGIGELVTALQGVTRHLSTLNQLLAAVLGQATGTFTLAASATTTVTQTAVKANSIIQLTPTNASAAQLMGSAKSLYHSANTPGASFALTTGNGLAAAGTEIFEYRVVNP